MNKDFFERGIAEIVTKDSLLEKLKSGKKLRIKMGFDPTRPDLHIGHAVGLRKLRELQDEGHTVIFLVGDYTTKIGDPSGRNTTRPVLNDEEIKQNAKTYFDQAGKILDVEKAEMRFNSEWFSKMNFNDILQLAGKFTVAQIIERDDFEKRLAAHSDIGLHEVLYPLMQAYDSVILDADIAFCGADQKFNELAGRELQKKMGKPVQDIVMTELLVGLDGKIKMSKSADNYIGITESAEQMFGKIMSIPDDLIIKYFELATTLPSEEILNIETELKSGANPRDIKMRLASEIVKLYHDEKSATEAEAKFVSVFSKKEMPEDLPEIEMPYGKINLVELLLKIGAARSNSEARRLIGQSAIKIDGQKSTDLRAEIEIKSGLIIQAGKLRYYKIK